MFTQTFPGPGDSVDQVHGAPFSSLPSFRINTALYLQAGVCKAVVHDRHQRGDGHLGNEPSRLPRRVRRTVSKMNGSSFTRLSRAGPSPRRAVNIPAYF